MIAFASQVSSTVHRLSNNYTSQNTTAAMTHRLLVSRFGLLLARAFAQMGFEECPAIQTGVRLH